MVNSLPPRTSHTPLHNWLRNRLSSTSTVHYRGRGWKGRLLASLAWHAAYCPSVSMLNTLDRSCRQQSQNKVRDLDISWPWSCKAATHIVKNTHIRPTPTQCQTWLKQLCPVTSHRRQSSPLISIPLGRVQMLQVGGEQPPSCGPKFADIVSRMCGCGERAHHLPWAEAHARSNQSHPTN